MIYNFLVVGVNSDYAQLLGDAKNKTEKYLYMATALIKYET